MAYILEIFQWQATCKLWVLKHKFIFWSNFLASKFEKYQYEQLLLFYLRKMTKMKKIKEIARRREWASKKHISLCFLDG